MPAIDQGEVVIVPPLALLPGAAVAAFFSFTHDRFFSCAGALGNFLRPECERPESLRFTGFRAPLGVDRKGVAPHNRLEFTAISSGICRFPEICPSAGGVSGGAARADNGAALNSFAYAFPVSRPPSPTSLGLLSRLRLGKPVERGNRRRI